MRKTLQVIAACLLVASTGYLGASEQTERIRGNLERLRTARFHLSTRSMVIEGDGAPALYETCERDFAVDLPQVRLYSSRTTISRAPGQKTPETYQDEFLRTKTDYLNVSFKGADKEAITVTTKLKCDAADFSKTLSDTPIAAPFGYIPSEFGAELIDGVLDSAMLTETKDHLLVAAQHKGMSITARYDRDSLLLRELEVRRPIDPRRADHSYHYIVDETLQVGGIQFPAKYRITMERAARPAVPALAPPMRGLPLAPAPAPVVGSKMLPAMTRIWYVTVDQCQLNSPLAATDFAIQAKIKNGTPVTMLDARQIRYRWQNGAPVIPVDD